MTTKKTEVLSINSDPDIIASPMYRSMSQTSGCEPVEVIQRMQTETVSREGTDVRASKFSVLFSPPPPHLTETSIYGLRSGFTKFTKKNQICCHGLISLHVNFHDNRTM